MSSAMTDQQHKPTADERLDAIRKRAADSPDADEIHRAADALEKVVQRYDSTAAGDALGVLRALADYRDQRDIDYLLAEVDRLRAAILEACKAAASSRMVDHGSALVKLIDIVDWLPESAKTRGSKSLHRCRCCNQLFAMSHLCRIERDRLGCACATHPRGCS